MLSSRLTRSSIKSFERECRQLRPLGEAYLLKRFSGSLNQADAEDIVAEVLIRIHRKLATDWAPENLRAFFLTSARNAGIDVLRSRAARPTVDLDAAVGLAAPTPEPIEIAEDHDDATRLQETLGRMRANYREAIVLRFGLGMTVPEIASHLTISLPAAKKLVLRATDQARKRLASVEGAEFCDQMRDQVRRLDLESHACDRVSDLGILRAHFSHCGYCRSFLLALRRDVDRELVGRGPPRQVARAWRDRRLGS